MMQRNWIGGQWLPGEGEEFASVCPVDESIAWVGQAASEAQVAEAFSEARRAFPGWWDLGDERRIRICEAFARLVEAAQSELAEIIAQETGKPLWDARTEVGAVVGKIAVSVEAYRERRSTRRLEMGDWQAVTRFKPHGVCAVLGPFNFPAHLPNGHIVPALIAGNTLVFKPSEQTPWAGQWLAEKWEAAGLPAGVLNLVQGGLSVGQAVARDQELDGLFFTGSSNAGRALNRLFGDSPQKILALEMGGNNPLVVDRVNDVEAAAYYTVLSAYLTSGQRCTCARRLIVVENERTERFIEALLARIDQVRVGFFRDQPEPFAGTVISAEQGKRMLAVQQERIAAGAKPLREMAVQRECPALLSPGLLDATGVAGPDEEWFGPLLQMFRVESLDEAIAEANRTRYGLAAALLSDDHESYDHFIHHIRAGIVNWNRQTTGASGKLPFGGCGLSGNHRPAAYYAADYCSFPTASIEADHLTMPESLLPGMDDEA